MPVIGTGPSPTPLQAMQVANTARATAVAAKTAAELALTQKVGPEGPSGPPGPPGPTGPGGAYELATIAVSQTAVVAIALGIRTVTVDVPGLKKGERVFVALVPPVLPGYGVFVPCASADGKLDIPVFAPALAIGANYTFNVKVFVFR